ncbi:MAG: type II secretion system protein [Candidatus Saccharimonadales bacterium]|jgi:type II secretory pathway pseudopilin PulG|nr:type II secretion system protein [Candidatus Saccharibacteria bacterium]
MIRGGDTTPAQGFTVVETLIVLAVTSALFLSAAILINGRQQKTEFAVGIRGLQQQIQQSINETRTGNYPSAGGFTCADSGPHNVTITASVGKEQGTNGECIFAGKTLVFDPADHPNSFFVYSLAARRLISGQEVKYAADAKITAVAPTSSNPSIPDLTSKIDIPNSIEYVKGRSVGAGAWNTNVQSFALLSTFADFQSVGNGSGGSQKIRLAGYGAWNPSDEVNNINKEMNNPYANRYPAFANGIELCFKSGGTNQSGLITISNGLEVKLSIKNGTGC